MDRRPQDHTRCAVPVDAGVGIESLVLSRDKRILHDLGNLVDLYERPPLEPQLGDEASIDRVELGCLVGRVFREDLDRRALVAAADQRPAGVEDARAKSDEESEREEHRPDERGVALAK